MNKCEICGSTGAELTRASGIWACIGTCARGTPPMAKYRPTRASVENALQALLLGQNHNRLDVLQQLVVEWADMQFPNRTPDMAMKKFDEEIKEVFDNPTSPDEWGDIIILVLDLMSMCGIDPHNAVVSAIRKNMNRSWAMQSDGTYHHVDVATAEVKPEFKIYNLKE